MYIVILLNKYRVQIKILSKNASHSKQYNIPLQPPENKLMELIDTHELKRGVSLMMDHLNLATPPVMVHIVRMVRIMV